MACGKARKIRALARIFPSTPVSGVSAARLTAALECGAFCTAAVFRISAFHTDLACMTFTAFIVHTLCRLTVHTCAVRRHLQSIAVAAFFSFLETVAAGFLRVPCAFPANLDPVKIAEKIIAMHTRLYCTF